MFAGVGILAALPTRVRGWFADRLATAFSNGNSNRRRRIATNLALCYPDRSEGERETLLRRHVRVAAHVILGYGRLMVTSRRAWKASFDVSGFEHVETVSNAGKNVILLTPHCMTLEHAGMRLNADRPIMTMIRVHDNPVADWVVSRMRTRLGCLLFPHDAGLMTLIRTLRRGIWFYYPPDEDNGQPGALFADFFGVQKATVPVIGRLARAADAVVVPMRSAYDPATHRFSIHFHAPLHDLVGIDAASDARQMNAAIERLIDDDPAQYLWMQKIFRTRPPGSPSLY